MCDTRSARRGRSPAPPAADKPAKPEASKVKFPVNLPKTSFPMKANLVQNEPSTLKRWSGMAAGKGLHAAVDDARIAAEAFLFHDGPPYANGNIHMGHLMNKCLKDFVVRSKTMAGKRCAFVPGWDCHGLPIEHKVMTELVEAKKWDKIGALPEGERKMIVRRECRKCAEKFVKLQGEQMQRLLTLGDYAHPYLTMDPAYEGAVLEVLADLVDQDLLYRALKPVHWSIANETALAEAELEYEDREDLSVYVDFEAADADAVYDAFGLARESDETTEPPSDQGATTEEEDWGPRPTQNPSFMIWTTTPWTLPANVGVAVNPKHEYALVRVDGNVTIMAAGLVEKVTSIAKAEDVTVLATTTGAKLLGLRYKHPFVSNPPACGLGRVCDPAKLWSVVAADYVTLEDGTGIVHTAPGHGTEDYASGLREHLPIYCPVQGDGTYDATAPDWLRGVSVWDANKRVTEWLRNSGHLFHDHTFTHSYPHDWRSKTPTIFRCTEQWFVSVDGRHEGSNSLKAKGEGRNLRAMALDAVDSSKPGAVKFVPEWGRNRMRGMLDSRPDWCVSRQRAWGLPIPAFTTPEGAAVMTAASVRAVARVVREKGSDAWFMLAPDQLLEYYDEATDSALSKSLAPAFARNARGQLKKGGDILDVWFESGSSWNAVLRERKMGFPADLYLEGSDQHRGWFQSSLLPALGATGQPPFKTLLTHGFMVDKHGKKMSKSLGNDIKVEDLLKDHGADVCRWWVASLSYENDVKVDMEFFALSGESYRKVRNTLRFMLSNLDDYAPAAGQQAPSAFEPASLDAWVLGEFDRLSADVKRAYDEFDYRVVHSKLYDFCSQTLSATYLAAVKDRLYCDKPDSARRRRTQAALWHMTDGLCRLLAPMLSHTADEAWRALHKANPQDDLCVHTQTFLESSGATADGGWQAAMAMLAAAGKSLEDAKAALNIQNPLDAGVHLPASDQTLARFDPIDLADLLGVSKVWLDADSQIARAEDLRSRGWEACARSWKRDGTVKARPDGSLLSDRDAAALGLN